MTPLLVFHKAFCLCNAFAFEEQSVRIICQPVRKRELDREALWQMPQDDQVINLRSVAVGTPHGQTLATARATPVMGL
jgi:hypothetical protein